MKKWVLLAGSIMLEVAATLALRAAVDHPAWFVIVVGGYVGALVGLSLVLRAGIAVGVAYGIWAAAGVTLTALLAAIVFGDPISGLMGLGIAIVIGGVLCIELGSQAAHSKDVAGPP